MNNAAVFRDACLDAVPAAEITGPATPNLALAVAGCTVAVRRFLAAGSADAIVNVSSRQAQRSVRADEQIRPCIPSPGRPSRGGRRHGPLPAVG